MPWFSSLRRPLNRPWRGSIALGCVLLGASAQAQYLDTSGGSRQIKFRPFTVSFGTTSGYDTGGRVFTQKQPGEEEFESSIYAGFNASGAMNLVGADTFLGARMSTGHTYYFQRTQNEYETAINIDSTFRHTFSPRWTLSINDNFVMDTEQQIGVDSALPNSAQQFRREGDYYINNMSINNSFLLAPRVSLSVTLNYGLTRYEDGVSANVYDRDEYGISAGPNYQLSSATTVGFSVGYSRSEHPELVKIFAPSPPSPPRTLIDRVNRNSETESFSVNFSHIFSSRFNVAGSVGVTFTQFQDGDVTGNSINPAVSCSANYVLDERTTSSIGYIHSISETEVPQFTATIQDTVSAGISRQFTSKIGVSLRASYSRSQLDQEFNASTAAVSQESGSEEAYGGSISTGYQFTKNLGMDLGYSYSRVNAGFGAESFDRDRFTFNVRYSF